MWRQIDLRKSKRKQKLIQRTQSKLEQATSRQVDQHTTDPLPEPRSGSHSNSRAS
ncbi:uncharacterized protein VP01_2255g2 [Puccinia sorghi]|uniref:Uncharacterized protein n=1 Tax=Puccinia sorghi TaxID=27349 RepID=A0A0L6VA99_9BASI|nr:uncharacterized protein VP01_2255g2 [Puccinia sorghi]